MIWCVEDDASIRDIEVYALQSTGFEAKGFEDGDSFLSALKTELPDLVILDVMLPGKDGIELLKILKSTAEYVDIPVDKLKLFAVLDRYIKRHTPENEIMIKCEPVEIYNIKRLPGVRQPNRTCRKAQSRRCALCADGHRYILHDHHAAYHPGL